MERGGGVEQEGGFDMIVDAQAERADHHEGEQEQEDPHAADTGGRNDPPVRFRQFISFGAEGEDAHPAQPFVKSRIFPVRTCRRWKISRTSAGVATMKTITAWITVVRSIGIPVVACI